MTEFKIVFLKVNWPPPQLKAHIFRCCLFGEISQVYVRRVRFDDVSPGKQQEVNSREYLCLIALEEEGSKPVKSSSSWDWIWSGENFQSERKIGNAASSKVFLEATLNCSLWDTRHDNDKDKKNGFTVTFHKFVLTSSFVVCINKCLTLFGYCFMPVLCAS